MKVVMVSEVVMAMMGEVVMVSEVVMAMMGEVVMVMLAVNVEAMVWVGGMAMMVRRAMMSEVMVLGGRYQRWKSHAPPQCHDRLDDMMIVERIKERCQPLQPPHNKGHVQQEGQRLLLADVHEIF